MDPARWEQVQAIFHRAAELDPAGRAQFLLESCHGDDALRTDVERMLEQDASASLLDLDVTQIAGKLFAGELSSSFRDSSPYRIIRMLGEGGMGVVYLAERTDLGNLVAIKILRDGWLSTERRSRFAAEQRTLAQLNHPSIARLYDASTLPDGTPWFVMEYVDGVPLTEYCRDNDCSLDQRLKLIRAVAEAVQYAHERGVVHRDLKPSNILVKADGSLRLLDFGIAKQLSPGGAATQTQFRPMTPAYASPEQLRGEPVGVLSDVYSLGVVLYELLTGQLPFDVTNKTPSEAGTLIATTDPVNPSALRRQSGLKTANPDLDALCLTAMDREPRRRYPSAAALVRDIDHYLHREPLEARRSFWRSSLTSFTRRYGRAVSVAVAILAVAFTAAALTLAISRKPAVHYRTVAVIPFENLTADHSLDFLSQALSDEIWRTLSNARSISLRPPEETRKYAGANRDPEKAGRELHVSAVASGRYLKTRDQLRITLELTDIENKRQVWSEVFDVPTGNMVAMQAQVAAKTRRAMAPVLGAMEFATESAPAPKNEEAYRLYLQAPAADTWISARQESGRKAIEMLQRSVALDPTYAPAWLVLAADYQYLSWWGNGGQEALDRSREYMQRAIELDPDNITLQAGWLLHRSSPEFAGRPGEMTKAQAYRGMQDLLRRRPDMARLYFLSSWVLRDVGLLDEAARECEESVLIDAQDAGARSCGVVFLLKGDYPRALDYLRMDPESQVSKAMGIDVELRRDNKDEALRAMHEFLPEWAGYGMLQAYLEHRPAREIDALARDLRPSEDPEVNYFSAAHLAYAGQRQAALDMLKRTIDGGYCSFPAAKADPMFSSLRDTPRFAAVEAAGMACQDRFQKERASFH